MTQPLTKEMLTDWAKRAEKENANIILLYDEGYKFFLVPNGVYSGDWLKENGYDYDKHLIQATTPESILKYNYATYDHADMSLDLFVELVNLKYGAKEI